jgi:GNAT superfamily N-acetyltransferase
VSDIVRDVSPASLARANEANLAEGLAACALAYGGEVRDEPDLLWCGAGLPSSGWNRVSRAQLAPETVDVRIEWVITRAQALGVPFQWNIGLSMRPADLGDALLCHGFTDLGEEPAMGIARAQLPSSLPMPAGVTVERVSDSASLAQWVRTLCAGFGMPTSIVESFVTAMSRDTFGEAAAAHYYLARLRGAPVATAALSHAAGVAGIFAVATIEGARRRGIGAAVTLAPLLDARARGYCVGVLRASELGYPVYAHLGFSEQFRYRTYLWRPG